ncbi:hypothetical protein [Kangiella sp. M94]
MKYLMFALIIIILNIQTATAGDNIARVSVLSSGELLLNGKPSDISIIESAFKFLKNNNGAVYYYRENPGSAKAPDGAIQVIDLVIKYNLPISFFREPDFSDDFDPENHYLPTKH